MMNPKEAARFLLNIYQHRPPSSFLTLVFKNDRVIKASSFPITRDPLSFRAPIAAAHSWAKEGWNIYFNCALHREPPPLGKRGEERLASASCFAHLDIDVGHDGHLESGLCPDIDSALEIINNWIPPTVIVLTGGGVHAYWRFKEPWIIGSEESRAACKLFHRRFQAVFRDVDVNPKGYKIDETHSLAQILRIPGTFNRKSEVPRPVKIHEIGSSEYSISTLEALLPEHVVPVMPLSLLPWVAVGVEDGFSHPERIRSDLTKSERTRLLQKARRYAEKLEPGITGTALGRHYYGFRCVLKMIGSPFYLNDDDAVKVLRTWAATCVPVFKEDDLREMMESCRKKNIV